MTAFGVSRARRDVAAQRDCWAASVLRTALVVTLSLMHAAEVRAQSTPEARLRASATGGTSFGDGGTALALSAALAYDLTRWLAVEFELAYARNLDFTLDLCPAPLVCILGGELPVRGRTVSLVPHVVVDLPLAANRVGAYVLAGAGGGHVRQRYVSRLPAGGAGSAPAASTLVVPDEFTRSNMTVALSWGGGIEVRASDRVLLGVDVRALHLLDEEATPDRFIIPAGALDTLRAGARVSWRF